MNYLQNRNRFTDIENKVMATKREKRGRVELGGRVEFSFFTQGCRNPKAATAGAARHPEALARNLHKVTFAIGKSKYHSTADWVGDSNPIFNSEVLQSIVTIL